MTHSPRGVRPLRSGSASRIIGGCAGVLAASALFCGGAPGASISNSVAASDAVVSFSLTLGDGSVRIPLAGNVMGATGGEAAAGTTGPTALLTELRPTAGPGLILTAGPPPVGGTVAYPVTTNPHSNLFGTATATTRGLIRGTPTGPGGGVINMVSIVGLTPTSASVTGVAFAAATADARTDPVVLASLAADTPATLAVDLLSNAPSDPAAQFGLSAFSSDPAQAQADAHFDVRATSNLPGLSTLFDLGFNLGQNAGGVGVTFTSPLMSAPMTGADFVSAGTGSFTLKPGKTRFLVPFTIPAGTLGTDPDLGPVGLVLNVEQSTATRATAVPEPTPLALLGLGLLALAARARQKRPGRP